MTLTLFSPTPCADTNETTSSSSSLSATVALAGVLAVVVVAAAVIITVLVIVIVILLKKLRRAEGILKSIARIFSATHTFFSESKVVGLELTEKER